VLAHQSPDLIAFLERIGVVDLVNASLADALTGSDDGEAMLAELSASHLFVEAVGRPGAETICDRPVQRQRRDLQRRAAKWFRDPRDAAGGRP